MKKVLMIFLLVFILPIYKSNALTICARLKTYVGVVSKSVNGSSYDVDTTNKTWRVFYDYTTIDGTANKAITGIAACNTVSGTINTAQTNLYTTQQDVGTNCWCKMEPVSDYGTYTGLSSYWTLLKDDYTTDNDCALNCATDCAIAMKDNTNTFRSALYDSIK